MKQIHTHVFDLDFAQHMTHAFFQTPRQNVRRRMETFDGRIRKKHTASSKRRQSKDIFPPGSVQEMSLPDTSRLHAGGDRTQTVGRDTTPRSDRAVRRLFLVPDPEFALSLREPGPVNQSIPNDVLKHDDVHVLELQDLDEFVRCTGCQGKHPPGAVWCNCC